MKLVDVDVRPRDGRDEMNLADFPISALPRAQKGDAAGGKLDRREFTATRYDPASRQRVQQKVTLTSTARDGLPTPADEHVILALLYVAKHSSDFADATVHFAPTQLFEIMGWAPNGRSYTRLRDVLRRLKSLTIRYENAWWDVVGRAYEEEVATGIISAYRIARQVSGPRRASTALVSWVTWTQQFHDSLRKGNLKRLDLETFFKLSTPTAQRMYRFLDKRFYHSPVLSLDLVEFACGHVGLTDAGNVAILKRRLAAGIEELEEIGFIEKASVAERYQKVKAGQWRISFQTGPGYKQPASLRSSSEDRGASDGVDPRRPEEPRRDESAGLPALELAREFYRLWGSAGQTVPGPRDLEQAALLLRDSAPEEATAVLACLVQVTRKEWPECRSLSGAAQKYLGDALKLRQREQLREASRQQAEASRQQVRQEQASRQQTAQMLQETWAGLPEAVRDEITRGVRARLGSSAPAAFVQRLCLEELGRRLAAGG
jgi:plasmid replication initiation protein